MKILDRKVSFDTAGAFAGRISSTPEEMLLFDIETTGLKKEYCRLYLIGCAYLDIDGWHIRQWLTEGPEDERSVLCAFADFACAFKTLVTFNGEGFDIPFISYKDSYYGLDFDIGSLESFDIYKNLKPVKKLIGAKSLSQKSLEGLMGIGRDDKLDGGLLIPYYYEYELNHSPENERLLLLHNFEDVLGMGKMIPALNILAVKEGEFEFEGYDLENDRLNLEFILPCFLPLSFKNGKVCAHENRLTVSLAAEGGAVKFPVGNYKDYYYLPEEDTVIHKDLARFVDKQYRKKAARENCFLKVEKEKIASLSADQFKAAAMNIINSY